MKSYKTEKQITPIRQNTNNRKQLSLFPRSPLSILRFPFTLILSSFFLLSPACRQAWFIFLLVSCGANDPVIEDNTPPGRRDYEWTVDTLYSPNNRLSEIWGATPKTVWLGGAGGITSYDRLWYFDGNKWEPYEKQYMGIFPRSIFGLSSNQIWLGGNDGKIWKWDGSTWMQEYMRHDNSTIWYIDGNSEDNIYALGSDYILHRIHDNWIEALKFPWRNDILKLAVQDKQIFLFGSNTAFDSLKFWEYKSDKLIEIYAERKKNITWASMNKIGDEIYFLLGRSLNRYKGGKFSQVMSFSESNFGYQVYGRNMKDLFIRMRDGVAHYNGNDIVYLYQFSNLWTSVLEEPLIFENDVFFAISDDLNGHNIVLHGRQKTLGQK